MSRIKLLIAPDSFKETLNAEEVVTIIKGVLDDQYEVISCPMADGGEGTMRILTPLLGGEIITTWTRDPLGKEIQASYGLFPKIRTAVIELAEASGLALVPTKNRNPLRTSTFGTGLLIREAIERGAEKILLTLGGSATNDGGAGMAVALGVQFLGENDEPFIPSGENLKEVKSLKIKQSLFEEIEFKVASDVNNPILGEQGAAKVFAQQKGASAEDIDLLEEQMEHFVRLLEFRSEKELREVKGLGAAGGAALFPYAFGQAKIIAGVELVAQQVGLEEKIKGADIVITGEGRYDSQSKSGKVVSYVQELCNKHKKRCIVICGEKLLQETDVYALRDYYSKEECMTNTKIVLKRLLEEKIKI